MSHYVDDLEEILLSIKGDIERFWYTDEEKETEKGIKKLSKWKELVIQNNDSKDR